MNTAPTHLPPLSPDGEIASGSLRERIAREIRSTDNWISFARFMELALYAPMLGYYAGGSRKFGESGDFVTAPELTPLFARALAIQAQQVLQASAPHILEVGAGSGRLACGLMQSLDALGCAPETYTVLELSGELAARQQAAVAKALPTGLAQRVRWVHSLPEKFSGLIVANELLDAMPVHLVHWQAAGSPVERGLSLNTSGEMVWSDRPAAGRLLDAAQRLADTQAIPADYVSEINLAANAWVGACADSLVRGALLLLDYGFPQREYYHPQRSGGTLMCHFRHHAHTDPLVHIGMQDITAHVDFSAVAEAGHNAGLDVAGYTTQAQFLMNCGILESLATLPATEVSSFKEKAAVQKLLSPAEMGELFKVIALTRKLETPLLGFSTGDRLWRL